MQGIVIAPQLALLGETHKQTHTFSGDTTKYTSAVLLLYPIEPVCAELSSAADGTETSAITGNINGRVFRADSYNQVFTQLSAMADVICRSA